MVLDGASSSWSKSVIGLPSVAPTADGKQLAVFYDGRREDAPSELQRHMRRDIGMALIQFPIRLS